MDVQLSQTTTISYVTEATVPKQPAEDSSARSEWWRKLPALFWATMILFSANLVIAGSLLLTERLRVDAYGQELTEGEITNDWRPSPYTEVVASAKRKVRQPEQLYPASFIAPEPSYSWAPAENDSYSYVHTYLEPAPTSAVDRTMTAQAAALQHSGAIATSPARVVPASYRPEARASGSVSDLELDIPRVTASAARTPGAVRPGTFDISPLNAVSDHSETATN
jgi:hypothetical protein